MAFFQVHFAPMPGVKKKDYMAVRPALDELMHGMVRRGQLMMGGRYAMSVGGVWLLRVRNKNEAEKLVGENPIVQNNLVTYRISEIVEPLGMFAKNETPRVDGENKEPENTH